MLRALLIVAALAAPALAEDTHETHDDLLGFALAAEGDGFVVRSDAYTVTFPRKPTVQTMPFEVNGQDEKARALLAMLTGDNLGFILRPIPRQRSLDLAEELTS